MSISGKITADIKYERYIDSCAPATPFGSIRTDGKEVYYVGTIPLTAKDVGIPIGTKAIRRERHNCRVNGSPRSCRVCNMRLREIGAVFDTNGHWLYRSAEGIDEEQLHKRTLIRKAIKEKEIDSLCIRVVDRKVPYPKFDGNMADGTPWSHLYIDYDNVTDASIDIKKLQTTVNKYTPLIDNLLHRIWGQEGLKESIQIFIDIAEKATYGDHIIPGAKWLGMVMDKIDEHGNGKERFSQITPSEKLRLIGDIIFSSQTDSGVITSYHQANGDNVLGLLAIANTESAMKKLMVKRLDPISYQRRIAPPSTGNIELAKKILGSFNNTIHTLDELRKLPGTVTIPETVTEDGVTDDVYDSMLKTAKRDSSKEVFNFASRAKISTLKPSTIRDLMTMINDGRVKKLSINTDGMFLCYTAKTTIPKEKLIHPYLWFYQLSSQRIVNGRHTVTDITRTNVGEYDNYIFRIAGLEKKIEGPFTFGEKSNCCFPVFLTPADDVRRICGSTFEEFNKIVPISIPDGPISVGLGMSVEKMTTGRLLRSVDVYINDCETPIHIRYG